MEAGVAAADGSRASERRGPACHLGDLRDDGGTTRVPQDWDAAGRAPPVFSPRLVVVTARRFRRRRRGGHCFHARSRLRLAARCNVRHRLETQVSRAQINNRLVEGSIRGSKKEYNDVELIVEINMYL